MRRLRIASLALLGTVLLFGTASPVAAGTIYTLDTGFEQFDVDPDGGGSDPATSFDITAAGFDLDLGTLQLNDFVVIGSAGSGSATLSLDGPATLADLGGGLLQLTSASATLTLDGSSSTVQLIDGFFNETLATITFEFFGGGVGSPGPPDLAALAFTASAQGGELPSINPIPEPSGLVLFVAGLLVVATSLRRKSA